MIEPRELQSAREHLASAESAWRTEDGLFHLEEALALLDELMAGDDASGRKIARNLAATYAAKLFKAVAELLEHDRALPEPDLEHVFRVMLAFDQAEVDLPPESRVVKIRIARRLIDRYYEGHPPEAKEQAVEELLRVSTGAGRKKRRKKTPRKRET